MSTYVISDIHGEYELFSKLLEKIHFSEQDQLYIIGDLVDRGTGPVDVLLKIMSMDNVFPVAGNHEVMAYECLSYLLNEVTDETLAEFENNMIFPMTEWLKNGGGTTLAQFTNLDREMQSAVLDYIHECMTNLYDSLKIGDHEYLLIHTGLENYNPTKKDDYYVVSDDFLFGKMDYNKQYIKGVVIISGHTPTQLIPENKKPGFIYKHNNHIVIDCGAYMENGRLAALRLEDMEEFYTEREI